MASGRESKYLEKVEETIFSELVQIRDQLKTQLSSLNEREAAVSVRETRMCKLEGLAIQTQVELSECIKQEIDKQMETSQEEVIRLEDIIQQKAKDNQRLKKSFDVISLANKNLKHQLDDIHAQNGRLESQLVSLQGRLHNLQRKVQNCGKVKANSYHLQQSTPPCKTVCTQTSSSCTHYSIIASNTDSRNELISLLMTGITCGLSTQDGHLHLPLKKVLQLTSQTLPTVCPFMESSCVEFIYSILQLTTKQEKSQVLSTLRRIGEQLHQPAVSTMFYKSKDPTVRTLSTLVILSTLTQVDVICDVLHSLREDLKQSKQCRELFLSKHGVELLVHLTQSMNKVVIALVTDIFLQMSVESALLPKFLSICCTNEWFTMAASLLAQYSSLELQTLETLSILIQRLSKLKESRQLFKGFKIASLLQRLLTVDGIQIHAPFLALNLQSTLLNLGKS